MKCGVEYLGHRPLAPKAFSCDDPPGASAGFYHTLLNVFILKEGNRMFDRLEAMIGKQCLEKIKTSKILVIGVGGVGGHVIESLVRSGIENIDIIDRDVVDITNLNRQLIALNSTIGKYKVDVMKDRLIDINPLIKIKTFKKHLTANDIESLNLDGYDYVVDAIDDVDVKVELAKYALKNNINLIVSTGTGRKMHPELLEITTLDKTSYDPLARKLRHLLKGEKINKLKVLSSKENPLELKGNVLGSSAFVPSVGGILIASYIINEIIND